MPRKPGIAGTSQRRAQERLRAKYRSAGIPESCHTDAALALAVAALVEQAKSDDSLANAVKIVASTAIQLLGGVSPHGRGFDATEARKSVFRRIGNRPRQDRERYRSALKIITQ